MIKFALIVLSVIFPLAAFADVLVDQPQTSADGFLSGSFNSNGGEFGATIADDFTLSSKSTIQQIQFTGSSEASGALDNSDFAGFQITVYDSSFHTLFDFTPTVNDLTPVLTGNLNSGDGEEFVYTLNTNFELAAGSYRLAVGAEEKTVGGGSAWIWSLGGASVGTNFDNQFDGAGWNTYDSYSDQAFKISGQPVPEPTTLAATALGGLAFLRRRRRA